MTSCSERGPCHPACSSPTTFTASSPSSERSIRHAVPGPRALWYEPTGERARTRVLRDGTARRHGLRGRAPRRARGRRGRVSGRCPAASSRRSRRSTASISRQSASRPTSGRDHARSRARALDGRAAASPARPPARARAPRRRADRPASRAVADDHTGARRPEARQLRVPRRRRERGLRLGARARSAIRSPTSGTSSACGRRRPRSPVATARSPSTSSWRTTNISRAYAVRPSRVVPGVPGLQAGGDHARRCDAVRLGCHRRSPVGEHGSRRASVHNEGALRSRHRRAAGPGARRRAARASSGQRRGRRVTGRPHQAPWPIRAVPPALCDRYLDSGAWTDDTLGALVDRSLAAAPQATINVWSEARPWHGTYSDVHDEAMRLVDVLRAEGLEAGDVVAFQLPNWREAIVAFVHARDRRLRTGADRAHLRSQGGAVHPRRVWSSRVPLGGSVRSRRLPRHHRRRITRSAARDHPARRHRCCPRTRPRAAHRMGRSRRGHSLRREHRRRPG